MTIEYIQKRIEGKEKEITKLQKKLERILKSKETNWEVNPYFYCESDLKYTERDLEQCKEMLRKYQEDLQKEIEKSNSRNVPSILMFLENWKKRCTEIYTKGLVEYYEEKKKVMEVGRKLSGMRWNDPEYESTNDLYDSMYKTFRQKCNGYYKQWEEERGGRKYRGETKVKDGEYEWLKPYNRETTLEDSLKRLEKDLEEEKNRKYDFIIERTNKIVGTITDSTGLYVGDDGDLNGFIIGDRGRCKVQTVGCGGWNIQCFHFRTLIHEV